MAQLVVSAGLGEAGEGDAALAQKLIDMVVELNERVGIPRGFEQIKAGDITELATDACKEGNSYPVPKYMDVQDCSAILQGLISN